MRELIWKIEGLNTIDLDEQRTAVIRTALWRVTATEGDKTATAYGEQVIEFDGAEEFTPYHDLSPEQVLDWVKKCLGEKGLANIEAEIDRQLDVPVRLLMPWETP